MITVSRRHKRTSFEYFSASRHGHVQQGGAHLGKILCERCWAHRTEGNGGLPRHIVRNLVLFTFRRGCFDFSYTREVANAKLAERKAGTYLVRLRDPMDASHPGRPFTVSLVTDTNGERKIAHKLIQHEPLNGVADYVYLCE